ncbi:uncharacterized protein tasor2 isoform X2 [Dunckerocampus dactyliophorus]|uniref:uncharacterized protein tasor2 isoform X2 n=1 Tax=Dunckerocampus dactyliophorus TaxID=161453 RepID=UPI002406FB4B|nr:uncharacterized protein tasor2 isoform X2 [Dunckerocampus dactyliophorus]
MESGSDRSLGVLIPVCENSNDFKKKILLPIQSAYLYEESTEAFKYQFAVLIKNPALETKYAAFREKKKQAGYTEEDLEETYGFLLFDDINKANALGQTGVLTGTSTCSSLGDPLKGVYISMYSDCLEPEGLHDSKSGYIAIIRLTTGRVRRVSENHSQDLTAPTEGFDCHVSQNLASVSPRTSFRLAFERTQCYIYELLDDGSNGTEPSPSFTCPFAIVAFSYTNKGRKRRWTPLAKRVETQLGRQPRDLISSKILRILPVLSYAGGEVEKQNTDANKGLYNVVAHPVQTYTVVLNPVLPACPPVGPGIHYIALSPPKQALASPSQIGSENQLNCEKECDMDEVGVTGFPRIHSLNDVRVPNKPDNPGLMNLSTTSTSDDVPAELIVSFTSEQSVTEKSPISTLSTRKPLSDEHRRDLDCPEMANLTINQQRLGELSSKGHKKTAKASFETAELEKVQIPSEDETLDSQSDQEPESARQSHQNATSNKDCETFSAHTVSNCSSRNEVRPPTVESVTTDAERPTMGSTVMDREGPKCERWNLRPVISECGRILVPHGSWRDTTHLMKSSNEQHQFSPPLPPASNAVGKVQQSSTAPGSATGGTVLIDSKTGGNYPQNVASPEQSTAQESEDRDDTLPPEDIQEHSGTTNSDQCVTKDEPKSILSKRKQTKHYLTLHETDSDPTTEADPSLKNSKSYSNVNTNAPDTITGLKEDSMQTSDETTHAIKETGVQHPQDSTQAATIKRRPPSIFPLWKQIKKLKKHQDTSKLHVKKKWRLHFQTPSNETCKQSSRHNALQKNIHTSNRSTDALNLLADLALGAANEQVAPQPGEEQKGDNAKDVASANQVSLLHALLRKPFYKPTQPLESSAHAEGMELVSLLCKEHAYSLYPSVGLPVTPFQVSPLSGSTGLLYHHQTMYGIEACFSDHHSENSHMTSKHVKKRMKMFKRYRSFVDQGGSVQVTRQWKEKYDFNRDSRFSVESKNRSIIRALHGPWNHSIEDTNEDVQLVVHMWIGLFYSRSTARFFDVNLDLTNSCLEERDCLETTLAQSELKGNPFAFPQGVAETTDPSISNTSDLSKKVTSLDQESDILDLSLRNPNVEIVTSSPQTLEGHETTIVRAETSNEGSDVSRECSWTHLEEDSYLKGTGEFCQHKDVTENHLQGHKDNRENHGTIVGVDHWLHGSNRDKINLKGGSENNSGDRNLSMVLKHGMDSSVAEKEVDKDLNDPVLHIEDDKEPQTFCKGSLLATGRQLARTQSEGVQAEILKDDRDWCFVKNDICISTSIRVLQTRDTVLPMSSTADESSEIGTTDVKHTLDQPSESSVYVSTFPGPSCARDDTKNKNAEPVQAAFTSETPQSSESSEDSVGLLLKSKSEMNPVDGSIYKDTSDRGEDEISQRTSEILIAETEKMSTDKLLQCRQNDLKMDKMCPRNDLGCPSESQGPLKQDMGESFQINPASCKRKYRFYILQTSEDSFYEETKAQLKAEGHTAVLPFQFFLHGEGYSSLLIVVRNEDIAARICEVPYLLELKKSPHVQFVGIDEPNDVMNRTYQELFVNGGFVMFDTEALESLSLYKLRKFLEILQGLNKTGKWKWFLHYRDSRRFKENARFSTDAEEKKNFLRWCRIYQPVFLCL